MVRLQCVDREAHKLSAQCDMLPPGRVSAQGTRNLAERAPYVPQDSQTPWSSLGVSAACPGLRQQRADTGIRNERCREAEGRCRSGEGGSLMCNPEA